MSFTYSGDPTTTQKDEVRFLLGDTDVNSQLISDEEINYLLLKYNSPLSAAINGSRALAAKFARFADETTGDISVKNSQISKRYAELADTLKSQLSETGIQVFAGGISQGRIESNRKDDDRTKEKFAIGMDDNERRYSGDDDFVNGC